MPAENGTTAGRSGRGDTAPTSARPATPQTLIRTSPAVYRLPL